jgi:transcriptional regulator CtsR
MKEGGINAHVQRRGIKMRMSDLVAQYIKDILEQQDGEAEIKRNELATTLGCVPSQINYVITSRFTPEQGYIVESRRGGGGYIRITRINTTRGGAIMHIVNSIGTALDKATAEIMLDNMLTRGIIEPRTAKLMAAAVGERAYLSVPQQYRDSIRATVFKNMLLTLIAD